MRAHGWWPREVPPRRDLLSAVGWTSGALVLLAAGLYGTGPVTHPALLLVPLAVAAGADLLRGTAPLLGLVIALAAIGGDLLLGGSSGPWLILTDLIYAVCVYGSRAAGRWTVRISVVLSAAAVVAVLIVLRVEGGTWRVAVQGAVLAGMVAVLVTAMPAVTGELVRYHRDQAAEHREHARQVERLAELDRLTALTAERTRMARELHDVVANHLSAIAIRSTAALRVAGESPGPLREALGVARENSVAGLAEMRRMIGLLRDSGGADDPVGSPRLSGLGALVGAAARGGLTVTLDRPGTGPVPLPVELAAYRIVQESLTNALKHAGPGATRVALERRPTALRVTVDSPLGAAPGGLPGAGAGLIGMTERAALLGGSLTAGPDGDRWVVVADLPFEGEPRG